MTEKEDDPGISRPAVAELLFVPLRIDQVHRTKGGDVKRHAPSLGRSRRQRSCEYLPCQRRLGDKAEQDASGLAVDIVRPLPDPPVLQDHLHRKNIEEDKKRYEDPVDEPWWVGIEAGAEKVNRDRHPGDRSGNDTEPVRQPTGTAPGDSYFSWSRPNKIMDALTPANAMSAAMSAIPTSVAISTTITEDDSEYSIHRA